VRLELFVSLPWFKAPTSATVAGMLKHRWTKQAPCPVYVASLELMALEAGELRETYSIRDLADRWGWSTARTYRWLKKQSETEVKRTKPPKRNNESKQLQGDTDAGETEAEQKRNASRARALLKDKEEEGEEEDKGPSSLDLLYEIWKGYHPRGRDTPRASDASMMRARLREDSLEDCGLVCRWLHEAPGALWWRDNKRLGLTPIFKAAKWSSRLEQAQAWRDAGYPLTAAPQSNGHNPRAGHDWGALLSPEPQSQPRRRVDPGATIEWES
jgi:hypothetical protein